MQSEFTVTDEQAGQRLDVFCVAHLPAYSRAQLQRAIKEGAITVNGKVVKPRQTVAVGDVVEVAMPEPENNLTSTPSPDTSAGEEGGKLEVLYEDKDVVVVNKPAGIEVHPGQVTGRATVVEWFRQRYPEAVSVGDPAFAKASTFAKASADKSAGKEPDRPGIVHRLDKDTSGVLVLAKTQRAYEHLKKQFQLRRAKKEYLALVFGVPGMSKGRIVQPLLRSKRNPLRRTVDPRGKEAITEWKIEEKFGSAVGASSHRGDYALLRVWPLTGRTHQIRVHLHWYGYPIVGDRLYTFKRKKPPAGVTRQLLHAEKLTLSLPSGKRKSWEAALPTDFEGVLEQLRSND